MTPNRQDTPAQRPLKVAYLVQPSHDVAGIERVVHAIASGLARTYPRLLDVHVVFCNALDDPLLDDPPYTTHVLGVDRLLRSGPALRRCVADNDFDILVSPQVEMSVVAWFATRGLRLPVLLPHLHGNPRLEVAEGTRRTKVAFALFGAVVARGVPAVLAVSPSLRDYAAVTIARHSSVVYVKNPVRDLGASEFVPAQDARFRFVCVARLARQKGQDLLLEALALARPRLPPVSLTLVGQGEPEVEASLREQCTRLGLDDIVTFTGYTSDPVSHLRASDCFVLASRWEGFGVALVEALQCGLPLLVTDCEFGPGDIVTGPEIGVLVAPVSPQALADGLRAAARRRRVPEEDEERRAAAAGFGEREAVAAHLSILRAVARVP